MTADKVIKKKIEAIHGMAVQAFENHQIEVELDQGVFRHIRCARPKSSIYHFNVTTFPGRLVVSGDIGFMAWERCHDMFEWVPGAIGSIDYFQEKVPHEFKTKEFDKDVAAAVLDEWLEEIDDRLDKQRLAGEFKRVKAYLDEGEDIFQRELSDLGVFDGCDWPDFTCYTSRFLWLREALIWFFDHYKT